MTSQAPTHGELHTHRFISEGSLMCVCYTWLRGLLSIYCGSGSHGCPVWCTWLFLPDRRGSGSQKGYLPESPHPREQSHAYSPQRGSLAGGRGVCPWPDSSAGESTPLPGPLVFPGTPPHLLFCSRPSSVHLSISPVPEGGGGRGQGRGTRQINMALVFPEARAVLMMGLIERRSVKRILIDLTSLIRICV